jgi:predicted regulator of Ras-like GTPase activity (Roadblock/LC7/MglB family)
MNERLMQALLRQVIDRRPYITALALVSPGGKLWASALPGGVEADSVAAMVAPTALLGRRIALEQLGADMRQLYVEGEGGYAIMRAIGEAMVLLVIAPAGANLALVLHDVRQLESRVAEVMGLDMSAPGTWAEAGPAIERLRRLVSEGEISATQEERLAELQAKLDSLDLGLFPERVASIRARLQTQYRLDALQEIEQIESDLLTLEQDVMAALDEQMRAPVQLPAPAPEPRPKAVAEPQKMAVPRTPSRGVRRVEQHAEPLTEREPMVNTQGSIFRRMLRWLATMIESED